MTFATKTLSPIRAETALKISGCSSRSEKFGSGTRCLSWRSACRVSCCAGSQGLNQALTNGDLTDKGTRLRIFVGQLRISQHFSRTRASPPTSALPSELSLLRAWNQGPCSASSKPHPWAGQPQRIVLGTDLLIRKRNARNPRQRMPLQQPKRSCSMHTHV